MGILNVRFAHGNVTKRRPLEDLTYGYGALIFPSEPCEACFACTALCPTAAIQPDATTGVLQWDALGCIFCGRCVNSCPNEAIKQSHHVRLAQVEPYVDAEAGAQLHAAIKKRYGRSLVLRSVDTGSCNACMLELSAASGPVYALQRFGVDIAASPRHADGIIVTGPVTINMREALIKTYEALAPPRLVIGLGTCTHNNGLYDKGHGVGHPLREYLPVDLIIPGCPPSPAAIIDGLLKLMGRDSKPYE